MSGLEIGVLVLSFLVLLTLGVPITVSISLSALFTLSVNILFAPSATTIAQRMINGLDSFTLLAIPFFILSGQIMNSGGIAARLIEFAKELVGPVRGGLIFVNIISCTLFGAISGSAAAAASAIGSILTGKMEKEGYDKAFTTAANVASATTGLLIPPSNVLIVYSLAAGGLSIGALFVAGYVPGIVLSMAIMLVSYIYAVKRKYPKGESWKVKALLKSFIHAFPGLMLLVIVMGGIVAGFFTATEASAIAVLYTLILSVVYNELTITKVKKILIQSSVTTSIVLLLVATSSAMSWTMSYGDLPHTISASLLSLTDNPIIVLILINLLLLLVGIFMDITPAILIFTPIFLPVVQTFGINPIHFGIIMVLNLCIGLCTPPVGNLLFVGASVANISFQKILRPMLPLYAAMLVILILIMLFPQLSLWLPQLFGM
ncbi:MAG: TRAP transporter large permease [Bacteroidota bacterium]